MRILPKVVQTLVTNTPDATRVRDNLTSAVQPTLNFLNGFFLQNSDGSLRVLKGLVVNGAASFVSSATFAQAVSFAQSATFAAASKFLNDVTINGNLLIYTRTANGVVIVPQGGTPAFYVSNPANTAVLAAIDNAGNLTANTLVASANGIPQNVFMGTYYNSSNPATTPAQTQFTVYNNNGNTIGVMGAYYKPPRAGSIVGYSYRQEVTGAGQNTMYIYKNGSQVNGTQTVSSSGTLNGSFSKGSIPFAIGDEITVKVMGTTGSQSFCASVHLTVEMTA